MTVEEVAKEFVVTVKRIGFYKTESILIKFCPKDQPDVKCFNVPDGKREIFVAALKRAV